MNSWGSSGGSRAHFQPLDTEEGGWASRKECKFPGAREGKGARETPAYLAVSGVSSLLGAFLHFPFSRSSKGPSRVLHMLAEASHPAVPSHSKGVLLGFP